MYRLPISTNLAPSQIRYTQDSMAARFTGYDTTIWDTYRALLNGEISVDDIEPIQVIRRGGRGEGDSDSEDSDEQDSEDSDSEDEEEDSQEEDVWWAITGNRRLYLYKALERIGLITTIPVLEYPEDTEHKSFTTDCDGENIRVRGYSSVEAAEMIESINEEWRQSNARRSRRRGHRRRRRDEAPTNSLYLQLAGMRI